MAEEKEHLQEVLARLELKDSLRKIVEEPAVKKEKAEALEEAVDEHSVSLMPDVKKAPERESSLSISYGIQEEHLGGPPVDYGARSYGEMPVARPAVYQQQAEEDEKIHEAAAAAEEVITVEESEEVVEEVQYAVLIGGRHDVNPDGLRKLDLRLKLEPSLIVLLTLDAVTRDVNYAPWA